MHTIQTSHDVINEDLKYIYNNLRKEFAMLAGKKLLITGGAGFLGYYLVKSIIYWNNKVESHQKIQLTIYDNYARGIPSWLSELQEDTEVTLKKHDVATPLPQDMDDFQYIIHAASIASPTYYRKHPIETMDANILGLRSLLEYCKKQIEISKPVEGFLFYSSSEIYGDPSPENIPTPETYNGYVSCTGPRACYDESKRYGETLCVNFARQYDVPIRIARPFNNYGPGLKITDKRVLPDFALDILANRDIVMLSDGSPTRTFCYIADAIIGYYKILIKGINGESYNIGTDEPEISMADLAAQCVKLAGDIFSYKGRVLCKNSSEQSYLMDNPSRRCPSIEKARTQLGYNPGISLEEGLRRSLIWYYDNNTAEDA